jgi:hypothetical protein
VIVPASAILYTVFRGPSKTTELNTFSSHGTAQWGK